MPVAKRRTHSRAKILAAAEAEFLAHGYLGTSVDAVALAAGVSKQTVYAHFASKEVLFLGMVESMVGGATADHAATVDQPGPRTALPEYLTAYAAADLAIVMTPRLMRLRRLVIGEQGRFPELAAGLWRHGPQASIERLAHGLATFVARGAMHRCEPLDAARHFNWLVMGGPTSAAMLLGDQALLAPEAQAAHVTQCVAIFVAAFAGPRVQSELAAT